jgi:succinate dehydrogenase / fumarate reductase cytochrome b subunit
MLRMYRGREGMISWALHRIAGLGILLFLIIHIADIYIVRYGAEAFNDVLFIYHNPIFRIMEIGLVAGVYFHAFNGIRIILIDFWDRGAELQRELARATYILFLVTFIPTALLMVRGILD